MRPVSGAISLTLLLIAFFVIEGVATILYAMEHKNELSGRWGWMLASGVIDLVLAVMIFAGLPSTAAWALGLLVGINMLFGGTALSAMALHARAGAGAADPQRKAQAADQLRASRPKRPSDHRLDKQARGLPDRADQGERADQDHSPVHLQARLHRHQRPRRRRCRHDHARSHQRLERLHGAAAFDQP